MNNALRLSVLDLVPVSVRQSSAHAVRASVGLAQLAERLGYERYWFAEHHNMPAVASTTPPILAANVLARTDRIRVGSGGVMLPNHTPFIVAEQFAALDAIAPGRVDLGIGRAPGSDPVITQLLRQSGHGADVDKFPQHVADIAAFLAPGGTKVQLSSGQPYTLNVTPSSTTHPTVWLLGSSDYSARLAAELGLPYVYANHFTGDHLESALDIYRSGYRPNEAHPEPRTFLTVNVCAAPTAQEAHERALPQIRAMSRIFTGRTLTPLETVEQALSAPADPPIDATAARMEAEWTVGAALDVATRIGDLARRHGLDEVMILPVGGSYEHEPLDSNVGREQTVELLAAELAA